MCGCNSYTETMKLELPVHFYCKVWMRCTYRREKVGNQTKLNYTHIRRHNQVLTNSTSWGKPPNITKEIYVNE